MAKKKTAKKRKASTRKKTPPAKPDPPEDLVEAAAGQRLDGLQLQEMFQKVEGLINEQLEAKIAPSAALITAALNLHKEIVRQGGGDGDRGDDGEEATAELALIRAHLAPLELGDESLPASELVRRLVLQLASK